MQLVQGDVQHARPLLPVAGRVLPAQTGRVVTGRGGVGRPVRRGRPRRRAERVDGPTRCERGRLGLDDGSDGKVMVKRPELKI